MYGKHLTLLSLLKHEPFKNMVLKYEPYYH